jgi:hypothetical protein
VGDAVLIFDFDGTIADTETDALPEGEASPPCGHLCLANTTSR